MIFLLIFIHPSLFTELQLAKAAVVILFIYFLNWYSFSNPPLFPELAQAVVDAGAVPLLVLCIQEPELSLKRIAASALSDICKHSPELAQTVVDAGAIAHLAQMILNPDAKLKVG